MKKFLIETYNLDQIIEALNCPINRHCTRVEHSCDDWELHLHPEWLIEHFIRCGGALEFAKRRGNKEYWVEVMEVKDGQEK